jgi:hypothetical protein
LEEEDEEKTTERTSRPGRLYFFQHFNSNFEKLQQNLGNRDSPPSQTGLHNIKKPLVNLSTLHSEKDTGIASPLVENCSPLVESNTMQASNQKKNSLLLPDNATTTNCSEIDEGFKQYLLAQRKRNWKQILQKTTKHGHILETKDASEILNFSNTKRRHIMESLVCLSKYQGTYNTWKEIKEKYQLKWT